MNDLISRQKAIQDFCHEYCGCETEECPLTHEHDGAEECSVVRFLKERPSVQPEQKWILVEARPMDNEERIEWSEKLGYDLDKEEAVIYTSQLPDDGQEVLVCGRSGRIWIDKFENGPDYGCCFEENGDMDGIVAWMTLPEPMKEE